jgi:hypothetical protein
MAKGNIPNEHERYLLFTLGHYFHSYFIKEIISLYLVSSTSYNLNVSVRHKRDWHSREKEQVRKGQNVMRNGINRMGLVFKIPLISIHARQKGTVDFIPNELFGIYGSLLVITIPTLKM